ncbi:class I SAM-dependent methyltransferase [Thauera sp.]|uniref:class I SAM-dependent methyltransferase n=1 Tax=Thauera sp. TaxID=1905334 RepID=UPI0039E37560
MSMPDLSAWLETPPGQYLLEWERTELERMVADIFGYRAVQIGLPGLDLLAANRMPFRFTCARSGAAAVLANEFELPFASASIDLVLMPHVLEFSADPHRVLREVERVLVPEGSVVLSGLNPISLWGLRRLAARRDGVLPWRGQYRSAMRIKDWLKLLGFEVQEVESGCHVPALASAPWLERLRWMDRAGARWWPLLGGAYLMHGVKRVQGMRLITPKWRERKAAAKRISVVAQRNGGTRKTT